MSRRIPSSPLDSNCETDSHISEDNESDETVRIYLTGFGPFGTHKINPSYLVVEDLDDLVLPVKVTGQKTRYLVVNTCPDPIPVEYDAVDKYVEKIWSNCSHYDYIIHLGVGSVGDVRFEIRARKGPFTQPDAVGNILKGGSFHGVAPSCPNQLLTTIPVSSICSKVEHLHESQSAGLFLCEYIYYSSLLKRFILKHCNKLSKKIEESQTQKDLPQVGFIHVPPIDCPWSIQEIETCVLNCLTEIACDRG